MDQRKQCHDLVITVKPLIRRENVYLVSSLVDKNMQTRWTQISSGDLQIYYIAQIGDRTN